MGTKNKIIDMTNIVMAQMEKLYQDDLTGEELKREIERGKALSALGTVVVNAAKVTVDAAKLMG